MRLLLGLCVTLLLGACVDRKPGPETFSVEEAAFIRKPGPGVVVPWYRKSRYTSRLRAR